MKQDQKPSDNTPATHTIDELLATADINVHLLSPPGRLQLANHWGRAARANIVDDIHEGVRETELLRKNIHRIHDDVDRRVLQTAQIIGVTTTGLAGKISTLRHVNSKVVICEEAGEVLEAHMLSTLLRMLSFFYLQDSPPNIL